MLNESIIIKRFTLAFSGFIYIFGTPYVLFTNLPLITLWIIIGLGLVRQLILTLTSIRFKYPFQAIIFNPINNYVNKI